ncbi:protein misato homolog 1 [Aplochiton taeniatus]
MGSHCREVITIQLGHYSNFVGTHWWNLQDASLSYDPDSPHGELQNDIVFREGQTPGGHVTYTPRLIAMDLKGSLQTLRQEGCLYENNQDTTTVTWEGKVMLHKESPLTKNPFLQDLDTLDYLCMYFLFAQTGKILSETDFASASLSQCSGTVSMESVNSRLERSLKGYRLEGSVRVWSDFLRIHLHPRTISVIHQYNHDGEAHRLEAFGQGEVLLQGSVLEDLEDKLHFFSEECDYLQGFQVMCDLADGFSGLGSKVTEMLQDTYGGRGILTWGLAPVSHPEPTPMKDLYHMLNYALGTVHLAQNSSFFCPLTLRGGMGRRPTSPVAFPYLNYDPTLWYHSSSILALALDSLTVPYRLRNNSIPMGQMADALAISGRKVVAAYGAVPFPMMHGSSLYDALSNSADALPWRPLSACPEFSDGRCFSQSVTLKGVARKSLISPLTPGNKSPSFLHSPPSAEDVLASYLESHYPATAMALQLVSSPSKLTAPFPQIFHQFLSPQGFLQSNAPPSGSVVSSLPLLTSLQSSPAMGTWLSEMLHMATALELRRLAPTYLSHGPELANFQESLEMLRGLARCYRGNSGEMGSSTEEDDDD